MCRAPHRLHRRGPTCGSCPPPPSKSEPPLIDEESRTHHFGPVVSNAVRKLSHRYRLANATRHDIRISNLINQKPCCGELRVGKTTLAPGDETEVEVLLSIRQEFGDVIHEVVVQTNPPQVEELVLRTTAKAYPAIRIEDTTPNNGSVLLSPDRTRLVEYSVFAHGTLAEPPIDLDRVELRSTIRVDWTGPKAESPCQDDMRLETRRFTALLDTTGQPGERNAEILLRDGEQVHCRHIVNWEIISPIMASPKLIVMTEGKREFRVVLQSRDQSSFRIVRIESKVSGVQCRAANAAAALTQTIEIERGVNSRPGVERGVITAFTDHPRQERVDLPFVVIE